LLPNPTDSIEEAPLMMIREVEISAPYTLKDNSYPLRELAVTEILIEVVACGVCATEYPVYQGKTIGKPGVSFRYASYPCFIGHEVSGVVAKVGGAVDRFKCGDRITGIAYQRSGFATHVIEDQALWRKVPGNVSLEQALGEPLLCVQNIINRASPEAGDSIVIMGDGFMSLLLVSALHAHYKGLTLYLVGHRDERLQMGKEFGADYCINAKFDDPYWIIRNAEDEKIAYDQGDPWKNGVDIVIDMTGAMAALQLGASLVKPKQRKKLVMSGTYGEEPFTLGHYLINRGPELVVATPSQSANLNEDLDRVIQDLRDHVYPMERLVTHAWSLDEIDVAIQVALNRKDGFIKGIIVPDATKLESPENYRFGVGSKVT
jgi:L-iditol 2-dehydrogenase